MATWNINPTTGNDSTGNGTTLPWKTVQKGHDMASAGDTLLIAAGTHSITGSTISASISKSLTVMGPRLARECVLDGGVSLAGAWMRTTASNVSLTIQNLQFRRIDGAVAGAWETTLSNIHTTVENCEFFECTASSTRLFTPGHQVTLTGSTFRVSTCLIHISSDSQLVMYSNASNGLICSVRNSLFIFECVSSHAFYFGSAFDELSIKNNIFYTNGASNNTLLGGTSFGTFGNNIVYASGAGAWTNVPSDATTLAIDPEFLDAANGDYRPMALQAMTGGDPT